ncbi:Uncharacterised protein [Anaerococcus prevotii]|uniref:Uncharacterized protein n=1 Tax=Anaerococcus prevotii (strain ATCC 9321 / DSM 20548 / JCM 6508 / NCTC 11806 / PC1) TaxID=525919 RepID=C7RE11_ANAPD|nr:hypothetical protein [Anaerococcus prevotii]ACV29424.1 hypothetical protein Apre_1401 [Anaerococcus prevotii DSM 20548]SUU95096.1 Uncharacterised protein [Anaerococcus prevotii]
MKREYKLSSIVIIQFIGILVALITSTLFDYISKDSTVLSIIAGLITSLISLLFQFAIASGLIRNRMGSVGEYLNQVNLITGRIILINIIVSLIVSLFTITIGLLGGGVVFAQSIIANGIGKSLGMILTVILVAIASLIFSILITYANFYLADKLVGSERKESLGTSIRNIFKLGKDLFGKTIMVYLKYFIIPIVIVIVLIVLMMTWGGNDAGMGQILIISILSLLAVVYGVFATAIVLARLSDNYLDYVEENEI